jgi:hypothetical protein
MTFLPSFPTVPPLRWDSQRPSFIGLIDRMYLNYHNADYCSL